MNYDTEAYQNTIFLSLGGLLIIYVGWKFGLTAMLGYLVVINTINLLTSKGEKR